MGEFKNYPETHLSPPTVIDLFSATFLFPPYMIRFRTQFLVKTAFQFLKIIVSNPVVKHLIHHLTHFWSISCTVTGIDLALTHFREIQSFQQKAVTHSQCHLGLSLNHLSGVSQLILLRLKVIYNYSPVILNMSSLSFTIPCCILGSITVGYHYFMGSVDPVAPSSNWLTTALLP